MKKIFTLIIALLFLSLSYGKTFAISPTPQPSEAQQDQIERIKELVASKVAELKLVEKRGLLGKVKETSGTKITIIDGRGNERIIDTDELTKFLEDVGSTKTFGISDIKKNEELSFIGLYNRDTERLLARVVTRIHAIPVYFEGMVIDKDITDFTVTGVDEFGVKKVINIENTTKVNSHSAESGVVKSGFSKINPGERILVAGFTDTKDKNQINATRLIHFQDIPPSSKMAKYNKNSAGEEVPVSTGSGKKLTPITQ